MAELDWREFGQNQSNHQSTHNGANKAKDKDKPFDPCLDARCFMAPCDVYSIAGAIALLLYQELNRCELLTMLNLVTLIESNLTALIAQIDINQGQSLNPLI